MLTDPGDAVVVTDFDGTLSPIVDDPDTARPLDGAAEVLGRLARVFAEVAVVSGRSAAFLRDRLSGADGVHLFGLYGMEEVGPGGRIVLDEAAAEFVPVVAAAADHLAARLPDGVRVEFKGPAVTVHWRQALPSEEVAVAAAMDEAALSGLSVHRGRMSVELRPSLRIDKGTVVRRLAGGRSAAAFFGDDRGDLPAYAELGRLRSAEGVTTVGVVAVDGETDPEVLEAADVVVAGPDGALELLAWLAGGGGLSGRRSTGR